MGNFMPKLTHFGGIRLAAVFACALISRAAWPMEDVIDRPALMSNRATQSLLLSVARAGTRLVAAGERGVVLFSDDNGRSWHQARVPVSVTLTSVHFVDQHNGWITGHSGILLHSVDGGETWLKTLDGKQVANIVLNAELANSASAGYEHLAEAKRLVEDGPDKPLLSVYFLSQQSGFVSGAYGLLLRTSDGGKTWFPWHQHLADLRARHLTHITQVNGELYIVGEQGLAYMSSDGGNTFKSLKSPYHGTFFGVAAQSAETVIIYGLRGNAFLVGHMGEGWKKLATPAPVTYSASARLSSGKTIIASQTGDLLSSDGVASLVLLRESIHSTTADLVEASDGALIVVGRGLVRLQQIGLQGAF